MDNAVASPESADSSLSAGSSVENGGLTMARKRVLSTTPTVEAEQIITRKKRHRVSSISLQLNNPIQLDTLFVSPTLDRLPRSIHEIEDDASSVDPPYSRARTLSRSSSFNDFAPPFPAGHSRSQSVARALTSVRLGSECPEPSMTRAMVDGMAFLRRSVSVASFQSPPPVPKMPETSAHHHFRYAKVTIDFSLPADSPVGMLPMSWSAHNIVVFARGNRVHYKSLTTSANEDIGQLCRIQDTRGDLRAIECGGVDQPNAVAFGTSKGYVQIWDIATKKMTSSWGAKGVTAMKWNGPVLTVGLEKGTLRHFDTRIKETPKMKEQARKFTRHQCGISSLAWNPEGKLLASGDHSGMIYCWDPRQNVPLDVGEMVQRRKKMQHAGIITALAWCPWKPKLLASGDSPADGKGIIRLWDIDPTSSYQASTFPEKLESNAQVTSLHFSPHCKEILSTHGPGAMPEVIDDGSTPTPETLSQAGAKGMANSIAVHTVPSLRHVLTQAVAASKGLGGSVLNAASTKVLLVVPEEGKLKMWDVWGKAKEGRRHSSFMDKNTIR